MCNCPVVLYVETTHQGTVPHKETFALVVMSVHSGMLCKTFVDKCPNEVALYYHSQAVDLMPYHSIMGFVKVVDSILFASI
jgi:hypothetical protein